jgi:DUF2075 family protein
VNDNPYQNLGWHGSLETFLQISDEKLLESLTINEIQKFNRRPNSLQISAWENSITILKEQLSKFHSQRPDSKNMHVIFEYELPREGGRRPDVLLLKHDKLFVIEFKDYDSIHLSHVDQVSSYARDLSTYHEKSHSLHIFPILIPTRWKENSFKKSNVFITNSKDLANQLDKLDNTNFTLFDVQAWINSEYAPLPSIVQAARIIFSHEEFPTIKRAHSAGIPNTIEELISIAHLTKEGNTYHLALVTGVPGAGKTLVGLQFVYGIHDFQESEKIHSVFLSGNGPLVDVLRHALEKGSAAFVQPVHNFLKEYGGTSSKTPRENIWIYDEAQRAWDAERVLEKRGHPNSEPDDFISISDKMPVSTMIIGLIGEGQNIHLGEEGGISLWNTALEKSKNTWIVHCPKKLEHFFPKQTVNISEKLDLTTSLRSHIAEDVDKWVSILLNGDISHVKTISEKLSNSGFELYITRNLDAAKSYVQERYQYQDTKRYGLICSSKAKILPNYGVDNEYFVTRKLKVGPWFNDPPTSSLSCCQLKDVCTEFACQGLELDFPVICWGDDFTWSEKYWVSKKTRSSAKDPHALRVNSYRVLLTRGRDGMIIFVPDDSKLDSTFEILKSAGCRDL